VTGLSAEALDLLQAASWPGNLRELYAVLRQACQRGKEAVIEPGDLPWYLRGGQPAAERVLSLDDLLEQLERRLVQLAMERSKEKRAGEIVVNKSRAGELLSISRTRLIRRLQELGIEDDATGTDPGV
jgi:transcriptional regulator with PAS, ATPase and Fis domain